MRSYHQGNSEAALELLLSGADSPDASSPQPEAVLGGSMSSGAAAEEEIAALVKAKAAAKYGKLSQAKKDTQLYSAARGGKTEEVEWLILAGANPNYVSDCELRCSPLLTLERKKERNIYFSFVHFFQHCYLFCFESSTSNWSNQCIYCVHLIAISHHHQNLSSSFSFFLLCICICSTKTTTNTAS